MDFSGIFGFETGACFNCFAIRSIEVVRFWISLIRLFIDWPQQGGRWISRLRTPKWAKNDY